MLGERRIERRCAGVVDAVGVARGEMGEDFLDELGGFDARDDAQRTATQATVFDVDVGKTPLSRCIQRMDAGGDA